MAGWRLEMASQLASLRRYLNGYRSFEWPELEDGLSAQRQIEQLMESASDQEIYCGWCGGNRRHYDADDMTECEVCDDLYSRDHLQEIAGGFTLCRDCGSECTSCASCGRFEHPEEVQEGMCEDCYFASLLDSSEDEQSPGGSNSTQAGTHEWTSLYRYVYIFSCVLTLRTPPPQRCTMVPSANTPGGHHRPLLGGLGQPSHARSRPNQPGQPLTIIRRPAPSCRHALGVLAKVHQLNRPPSRSVQC
eukprot:SAG11_NODE_167_length_13647_cov_7.705049_6_plen_247_part_00